MKELYRLSVAGLERDLPVCRVTDELYIAAFIMIGDAELTIRCAEALLKVVPKYDCLLTAEAKGMPLIHEMARQNGDVKYFVARKGPKLYMQEPLSVYVKSITTANPQTLYIDKADADYMRGRRVLIVDDVISTGQSLAAMEELVKLSGGTVAGRAAVLAEGEAKDREDIVYLEYLPLLNRNGEEL